MAICPSHPFAQPQPQEAPNMTYTLPHKFEGGGYEVTINADRSILVRQGDWLSKYSMAIYGDFNHIKKFKEKIGTDLYRDVPNPNLIRTGDTLYHPELLPDEAPGVGARRDPGGQWPLPPMQGQYLPFRVRVPPGPGRQRPRAMT